MVDVSDWNDLDAVRNDLNGNYDLIADLDENTTGYNDHASATANGGDGWLSIGTLASPFTGSFDGNGHTIADLHSVEDVDHGGLFGHIEGGMVEHLTLDNADVEGDGANTGALIGWATDITVRNCHVTNSEVLSSVSSGAAFIGVIFDDSLVEDCSVTDSTFHGNNDSSRSGLFSGFVGMGNTVAPVIQRCRVIGGSITNTQDDSGGFLGRLRHTAAVIDCYTQANTVSGIGTDFGGFAGNMLDNSTINRCYSAVTEINGTNADGFVARSPEGDIDNSFWDEQLANVATGQGATAKTTAEMRDIDTYTDVQNTTGLDSAWDMVLVSNYENETWAIDDGIDYPILGWSVEAVPLDVTGTVLFDDTNPVEGALITGLNMDTETTQDTAITDSNGDYSLTFNQGDIAKILFEYYDEIEDEYYNAESKPFVVVE